MQQSIPKRIIQTGNHADQPLRNRAMMASVRRLSPDYDYLFFDEEQRQAFIDREFPEYRAVFDSFPFNIQRYDFFEYLAVYRYGGFYLDLDVLLASSLSDLLEFGCVFPFERITINTYLRKHYGMDWEIGNYAFGAAPGHPFLKVVIDNCVKAQREPGWVRPMMQGAPLLSRSDFLVFTTTGPGLISRTLAENPELAETVKILFPEDVNDMRTWFRFGEFGIHMMDGTWRPSKSFIRRHLGPEWEGKLTQWALNRSTKLGKTRHQVPSAK
jgi:hypothetical protein